MKTSYNLVIPKFEALPKKEDFNKDEGWKDTLSNNRKRIIYGCLVFVIVVAVIIAICFGVIYGRPNGSANKTLDRKPNKSSTNVTRLYSEENNVTVDLEENNVTVDLEENNVTVDNNQPTFKIPLGSKGFTALATVNLNEKVFVDVSITKNGNWTRAYGDYCPQLRCLLKMSDTGVVWAPNDNVTISMGPKKSLVSWEATVYLSPIRNNTNAIL